MKKLMFSIFLSFLALFIHNTPIHAVKIVDPNYPGQVYNTINGTTDVEFTSFNKTFDRSSIQKFVIPQTINSVYHVTQIGNCAFQNCSNLEELVLPPSINKINVGTNYSTYNPFLGCNSLRAIYVYSEQPPIHTLTDLNNQTLDAFCKLDGTKVNIYVPASAVSDYKISWNYFANILPATENIQFDDALNFMTYYSNHHLVKSSDLEAFTVSKIDEDQKELVLTPLDGNEIPAFTGVILKGEKGVTYTLNMEYNSIPLPTANLLKGTVTDTVFTDYVTTNPVYILVNKEGQPAFCPMTTTSSDNNYSLKAHKGFIPPTNAKSNKYKISDGITGLREVTLQKNSDHNGYDLNGCPRHLSQKGIFILNHKKYLLK